jgi:hypothetical protein
VIGSRGRVTGTIGLGLIGEILLSIRGGTEAFYAYSANPEERLEWDAGSRGRLRTTRTTQVLVVDLEPPRTVYVERWQPLRG